MRKSSLPSSLVAALALAAALPLPGSAAGQSRDVLPIPPAPFAGVISETAATSKPDWWKPVTAPAEAPNILVVLTDDVGFASPSTFGGPIPTPNLERLARSGLRYNQFHTTAMCSPTRAALLTGRNHHQVATGVLVDSGSGFPGYNGVIPESAATIAQVLGANGYSTGMWGKHHNAPKVEQSTSGPFDHWPTGLGFDYFFGFIGGDTHQWTPSLFRNVTPVKNPPGPPELLDKRMADDMLRWIHNQKAATPDRPFLAYLATGTIHAPHHAPPEWIARFKGQFDQGWEKVREETLARQKAVGVVPRDTKLTPRPDVVPAWNSLKPAEKAYHARMMEVAAAALAYQDAQFGRILDELERMGLRENTLIIFIEGDNGASGEGTALGTTNELMRLRNATEETSDRLVSRIDAMGGPLSYENYSVGWTWAMNTPLQWYKQIASHLGGTRNGMVMSWPKRIRDVGGVRSQFTHVIDVAPTIYAAAGVPAPKSVGGVLQQPIDGVSLLSTIDSPEPVRHTQYFELFGSRGIYHDGWFASTTPRRMGWETMPDPKKPYRWELYNIDQDFSQARDLAKSNPAKLEEMKALWEAEARRNQVYPIDENFGAARRSTAGSTSPRILARSVYDYWGGDVSVAVAAAPNFSGRPFTIDAEVTLPAQASGVILANGSVFAGWSFFLEDGRPVLVHAFSEHPQDWTRVQADRVVEPGEHKISLVFVAEGGPLSAGSAQILIDGAVAGEGRVPSWIRGIAGLGETLDVGRDTGAPVTQYKTAGGALQGEVKHVRVTLGPPNR